MAPRRQTQLTSQPATRLVDGPPDVRHVGLLHCLLAVAQAQALQDAHVVLPRPRKAALERDEQAVHGGAHAAAGQWRQSERRFPQENAS